MAQMSKWERVEAAIQQQPVDRTPWGLWRHFYDRETNAPDLARVMLDWQTRNDFDLLKVNPRAQYHAEVWGCRFRYSGQPDVKPTAEDLVIKNLDDWQRIEERPPSSPPLEEQLQALTEIGRGLRGAVPFVETVFSPLGVAGYLISDEKVLRQHLREQPKVIHQALQAISATFVAFVHEVLNAGASGIFFATTSWATRDMLTEDEYETFGRPYDLQVLQAAGEARVNVLHVCRKNNMLNKLHDYPVHILNWAVTEEGNPSLGAMADVTKGKAVAGGISNDSLTKATDEYILKEVKEALSQAGNRGLLLAGNCSIPVQSSQRNIDAIHRWLLQN